MAIYDECSDIYIKHLGPEWLDMEPDQLTVVRDAAAREIRQYIAARYPGTPDIFCDNCGEACPYTELDYDSVKASVCIICGFSVDANRENN